MVKINITIASLVAIANLLGTSYAHPGEHEHYGPEELARRAEIARGLERCASTKSYRHLMQRANERLSRKAETLREKRGLAGDLPYNEPRTLAQLQAAEAKNHDYSGKGYTKKTKPKKLFATYKNSSCVLAPEVTQGPYWITGEYIRRDVTNGQKGVPVHLEYQIIDTNTCKAAPNLYVDIWHTNSTGVYSGVVARGNGNYADASNINSTNLRGAQKTNAQGVASFDTIFPGHYTGRTTHMHMMVHQNVVKQANGTYTGGTISHVGQVFFPEALKAKVEALAPYSTNTQASTTNSRDSIAAQGAGNNFDPFPDYAYLGSTLSDGLLMWIAVGVDLDSTYTVGSAGTLTASGGVANSGGGGPGGPPK